MKPVLALIYVIGFITSMGVAYNHAPDRTAPADFRHGYFIGAAYGAATWPLFVVAYIAEIAPKRGGG